MQLSNKHRTEFVDAVMRDVPSEPYITHAEDIVRREGAALRKAAGLADIPNERLKYTSSHIYARRHKETKWLYPMGSAYVEDTVHIPLLSVGGNGVTDKELKAVMERPDVLKLVAQHIEENNARVNMGKQIRAVIDGCKTLKQAIEALPEFANYLPLPPAPASRSVPVVGNLVATLTKAGWPDKKKKAMA